MDPFPGTHRHLTETARARDLRAYPLVADIPSHSYLMPQPLTTSHLLRPCFLRTKRSGTAVFLALRRPPAEEVKSHPLDSNNPTPFLDALGFDAVDLKTSLRRE